jgi:hypothetical protein
MPIFAPPEMLSTLATIDVTWLGGDETTMQVRIAVAGPNNGSGSIDESENA